jgi:hypothetical protein
MWSGDPPAVESMLCPAAVVRGPARGRRGEGAPRPQPFSCSDPFYGRPFVFYNILALFRRFWCFWGVLPCRTFCLSGADRLAQIPAVWGLRFPKGSQSLRILPRFADTGRRVCASHRVVRLTAGRAGLRKRRGGSRTAPTDEPRPSWVAPTSRRFMSGCRRLLSIRAAQTCR